MKNLIKKSLVKMSTFFKFEKISYPKLDSGSVDKKSLSKLNFLTFSLILASLLSVISSCSIYQSEFEIQSDKGTPIQKIELESSLILTGVRGVTTQTLTASYYPSTAQDTEITWTSSNESVVSISSSSGTTCTLTLQGNGDAQVTAKNSSGKVSAVCKVTGNLSTSSPFEAQDFSLTSYSNNIKATWKTPSLNAEYLSGAIFKVYETDFNTLVGTTQISGTSAKDTSYSVRLGGGISNLIYDDYTISASGYTLDPSSQYKVEIYVTDLNGNLSLSKSQTVTTLASDTSFPSSVSNAQISDISNNVLTFTWTDSSDSDLQGVLIKTYVQGQSETSLTDIFVSAAKQTAQIQNLSEDSNYSFYIYSVDDNFNLSDETKIDYNSSVVIKNITSNLSSDYSGLIDFSWTDPSCDFSKIKISASSSYETTNSLSNLELEIEKGTQTASFENLMAGYEYTFTFEVLNSNDDILSSKSYKSYPSKVLIRFYSIKNSGFMVVTSGKTFKTQDGASAAYHYKWLKMKALDGSETITYSGETSTGTVQTYSIMAMNLDGTASGLYAYLTTADSSNSNGKDASMTIAESSVIEAASLQKFATFFNAAVASSANSSYKALRFTQNYYQLGGNGSSGIYYRTSEGAPGVENWLWTITQEIAN